MQKILSLLMMICFGTVAAVAQQSAAPKQPACSDAKVHGKLVSIDKEWESKQYKLVYFSSENVPSKAMVPFKFEVKQGETYQINYVVGAHASKYQVTVVDEQIKEVVKEKGKTVGNEQMTVVSKQFTAHSSGVYMLVFSQQTKAGNCVGISLLKK
ncbi:hypothetical protein D3C72_707030 [compost metagenome]